MLEQEAVNLLEMLRDPGSFELGLEILENLGEPVMDWLYSVKESTSLDNKHPFWHEYNNRRLVDLARGTHDRR